MHIIGIAGLSCSGKTTLANRLSLRLEAPVISLDDYYLGFEELSLEERKTLNFDAPEMFDSPLLLSHLHSLARGEEIHHPSYDFVEFARGPESVRLSPSDYVIVEGQYTLFWPEINELLSSRIYLDIAPMHCLERRIERDILQRNRSEEEVRWRFHRDVLPMFEKHMQATSKAATIVIYEVQDPLVLVESVLATIR